MSANKTTKREKGKKRKKLTLNSRISPLEKDTIISSFFVVCFVKGGTFLSFFSLSLVQKEVSLTQTHINIQFLSLSFSL